MLFLVAVVATITLVPLVGGSRSRLGEVALRSSWLLALALAGQVAVTSVVRGGPTPAAAGVHIATYVFVAGWLIRNRNVVPGMWMVGLGAVLNFVAIVANGGTMPARAAALTRAGLATNPHRFANSAALHHPRLLALGDVFAVPKTWPLANVFSVGDVVLALGVAIAVVRVCRPSVASGPCVAARDRMVTFELVRLPSHTWASGMHCI